MARYFLLIMLFSSPLAGAQSRKRDLISIYTQAIADFIKAANQKNSTNFDTLFIGKRANGQADDFPDITLPQIIAGTYVVVLSSNAIQKSQEERKSRIYLNLVGRVDRHRGEFIFAAFSQGFRHLYDYKLKYRYHRKGKEFELTSMECEEPHFEK